MDIKKVKEKIYQSGIYILFILFSLIIPLTLLVPFRSNPYKIIVYYFLGRYLILNYFANEIRYVIREKFYYYVKNVYGYQTIGNTNVVENEKTLMIYHPHGVFSIGCIMSLLLNKQFDSFRLLVNNFFMYIPIISELLKILGTTTNIEYNMKKGKNIAISGGGFDEMILSHPKTNIISSNDLNKKKIIAKAMMYHYKLQPVYVFGETDVFDTSKTYVDRRLSFASYGLPLLLFNPIFRKVPLLVAYGEAYDLPKLDEITYDDINKQQNIYINKVEQLYNKYLPEWKMIRNDGEYEDVLKIM